MNKIIPTLIIGAVAGIQANAEVDKNFNYHVDRFADIEVLRYEVPEFDRLTLQQKKMVYYLSQAAQMGRDIIWDQNCKYNLQIRRVLEEIYTGYEGDKTSADYKAFEVYMKQVWFGNGIHHHYSTDKFKPGFSREFFMQEASKLKPCQLPLKPGETSEELLSTLSEVIFNPDVLAKRVNQDGTQDVVATSAGNYYGEGVTQTEVEAFYNEMKDPNDPRPVSYGLNRRVVKGEDGKLHEQVYRLNELYGPAISEIIYWLEKARTVAENEAQKRYIAALIGYYITGDLKTFDEYSILWAEDTKSDVDFVNGFIESYGDPLGMTGAWESYVNFRNAKSSERTEIISKNAQWFEDHSPVDSRFKKEVVKGVSAKVINAAMLGGDAFPSTAIGINLPNSNWIRAEHGSKSVTIENITEAYDKASHGNGFNEEFVIDKETSKLMEDYLYITDMLHTDLHECLGHGSGKLLPGVDGDALKENGSTLEEARADLFALYYLADQKLIDLGILDNPDAYQAEYYKYIMNGMMTQLNRIELGNDVEEAHMRNRQLIARWAYEHGKKQAKGGKDVIALVKKGGKTYVKINDYAKLRELFGKLLSEIQRIKSEGDYKAGNDIVQKYAVKVDRKLHKEVIERFSKLNIPPYRGFINPVYTPVTDANGEITDIQISWPENYVEQMLRLSRDYSPLTKCCKRVCKK